MSKPMDQKCKSKWRGETLLNLSLGEPCYGPPESAKTAAAAENLRASRGYTAPGGMPELRDALVGKLRARNKIPATANETVVTTGASMAISCALLSLCEPGDTVLLPEPGFPLYERMLETFRLRSLHYSLRNNLECEPNWDQLVDGAQQARVLIWNFPSNPLGVIALPEWLSRLDGLLSNNPQLYVISDEVYEDLVFEGKHISPAANSAFPSRIISVFSFSKSYGMTGSRVGYVHAAEKWAGRICRVHWANSMSTPTASQRGALVALDASADYHDRILHFLRSNRTFAFQKMSELGLRCAEPQGGFFLWADISDSGMDCKQFATGCAEECNVLVSPGHYFGRNDTDHIRVCFAVEPSALIEGLDRIGEWLRMKV